jgi:CRISPR-associated endoribonuclease Cas6
MPYSIVLNLLPHQPFNPSEVTGERLQAVILQLIGQVDPDLAAELHDGNELRQYAIAVIRPKLFLPRRREQPAPVRELMVRVASLDDRVYPAIAAWGLRLSERPAQLKLEHVELQVARILVTSQSGEPWAGYATFDQLLQRASDRDALIQLEFATPVCFRQGSLDEPLPLPRHVFGAMARRWNAAFQNQLPLPLEIPGEAGSPEGLLQWIEQHLVLTHPFQFRSGVLDEGSGRKVTGFVGRATYRIIGNPGPAFVYFINLLADAAFFMGLGKKTSRGCGMTRRITNRG